MSKRSALIFSFLLLSLCGFAQNVKTYMAEGDLLYGKKKYKSAVQAYQKALAINPDDAQVNFKLGLAYLYSDTKSKAATFIDKAYRLKPTIDNRIDYYLGIAFQNTNDFKRAVEHFESFKKTNPNVSSIADDLITACL